MPNYEYHCKECDYTFESFYSIAEKEKRDLDGSITCEKCGSGNIEQVFGGFSILTGIQVRQNTGGSGCCGGGNCC